MLSRLGGGGILGNPRNPEEVPLYLCFLSGSTQAARKRHTRLEPRNVFATHVNTNTTTITNTAAATTARVVSTSTGASARDNHDNVTV